MTFEEYRQYDAVGLAELIKKKEVTSPELLEIAIQRTEAVNPQINAVIHKMYDEARKMAQQPLPESPLAGVPFLIKDLGILVKDVPMANGNKGYKNFVPQEDSELTKRFRAAGLVFFGKTSTPEFGLTPFTEPEIFGATRNPWDLERTSGGSSGGSSAAVAAGIVPIATASDGGGSIRIPASCCGLFGLKVSRGRVSLGNAFGESWSGAVVENNISRSVRDSAAFLDAVQGPGIGELYLIKPPVRPYLEEVSQPPKKLKIAFCTEHPFGQVVDNECITAVQESVKLLKELGHSVEEVKLPYTKEVFTKTFLIMTTGEVAADLVNLGDFLGRKTRVSDVELNTWLLAKLGGIYSAQEFATAKRNWNVLARQMGYFHEKYDLFLTPTLANEPIKIGQLKNTGMEDMALKIVNSLGLSRFLKGGKIVDQLAEKAFSFIPYTPVANMTGQPSMSVPLYWTKNNLPIGVMFNARICEEDLLYRLAGQLEKAAPWFDKVAM